MSYSNLKKGLIILFIAHFFTIISTLIQYISSNILNIVLDYSDGFGAALFSPLGAANALLIILSLIAMTVAGILNFTGYVYAAKDEGEFRKSMFCVLVVALVYIIGFLFKIPNDTVYIILSTSGSIIEMFAMVFSVSGIINLSIKYENDTMVKRGDYLLRFILVSYIFSSVNSIVFRIFELSSQIKTVSEILGVIDLVINIAQFIVYMVYIRQAVNMMEVTDGE